MTAVADFVTYIKPYVTGCPEVYIEREVVEAAIKLCSESFLWRSESDPHAIVATVREYDLYVSSDYDADPVQLESVTIDGADIHPSTAEQVAKRDPKYKTVKGSPTHYYHLNSHTKIAFNKTPDKTSVKGMNVMFSLKPKPDATTLPDFLFMDWRQTIIDGALSKLLMMTKKEWADPQLAKEKEMSFLRSITESRIQVNNQWSDNQLRARGRRVISRRKRI